VSLFVACPRAGQPPGRGWRGRGRRRTSRPITGFPGTGLRRSPPLRCCRY